MSKGQGQGVTKGATPSVGGAEVVALRNGFYRDNFRTLALSVPVLAGALVVSIALNAWLIAVKPEPRYFTVDKTGRMVQQVPSNVPYLTAGQLLNFAAETVNRAYRWDAVNFRGSLQEIADRFTPDGHQAFIKSLSDSGWIEDVQRKSMIVSSAPRGAPVIVGEGVSGGIYGWKVRYPIIVSLRSGSENKDIKLMVTLVIVRRNTTESEFGVGISQFIASTE